MESRFVDCLDTEEGSKHIHNVGKILTVDVVLYLKSLSILLDTQPHKAPCLLVQYLSYPTGCPPFSTKPTLHFDTCLSIDFNGYVTKKSIIQHALILVK
jgi:hypothetical protein